MESIAETPSFSTWLRSYPFRLGIYGVLTFALFQGVFVGVDQWGAAWMGSEDGPIELSQLALAVMASVLFFWAAYRSPTAKAALVVCGSVVGYAAARESDRWFEQWLFDDAYKWLVGLPLALLVAATIVRHRRTFLSETFRLSHHPSATVFMLAGIFLGGVCQPLDRPGIWSSVSDSKQLQTTKAMIEEYAELFAYLLFFISAAEVLLYVYQLAAQSRCDEVDDAGEPPESLPLAA